MKHNNPATIAILHPGEMGSSVAKALVDAGHEVLWASEGRSDATRERAREAGLVEVTSPAQLIERSQAVISLCPPHAAIEVATLVAGSGFRGVFVDANAISPRTASHLARVVTSGGADYVDGGVIGGPAAPRLYLSGPRAKDVGGLFTDGHVFAVALGDELTSASSLKMCYAAYTKGTAALLLAIRALARHLEVEQPLLEEWEKSQPALPAMSEAAARGVSRKAWRFAGEMEEISQTFEEARLPGGFHAASADLYRRLAAFKQSEDAAPADIFEALRR